MRLVQFPLVNKVSKLYKILSERSYGLLHLEYSDRMYQHLKTLDIHWRFCFFLQAYAIFSRAQVLDLQLEGLTPLLNEDLLEYLRLIDQSMIFLENQAFPFCLVLYQEGIYKVF